MKKTIFEEMGGTYIGQGDYLIPYSFFNGLKAFICMFFDALPSKMNNGITEK